MYKNKTEKDDQEYYRSGFIILRREWPDSISENSKYKGQTEGTFQYVQETARMSA